MKVIKTNLDAQLEIKKSKFIAKVYKVNTEDEIYKILSSLKREYKDATHICYAYKLEGKVKYDDDKEPSGTSGYPILQVIEKQQLEHILAVVIRYFGGIKLGAPGLVRAYSKAVQEALLKKETTTLVKAFKIMIELSYEQVNKVEYILKEYPILEKKFEETVKYTLLIPEESLNKLESFSPQIIEATFLEWDF